MPILIVKFVSWSSCSHYHHAHSHCQVCFLVKLLSLPPCPFSLSSLFLGQVALTTTMPILIVKLVSWSSCSHYHHAHSYCQTCFLVKLLSLPPCPFLLSNLFLGQVALTTTMPILIVKLVSWSS